VFPLRPKVKTIIDYIEVLAPPNLAAEGDPTGFQIGDPEAEISKILVSLDPDEGAIEEAVAKGAEMLVTHHPFIFQPLASVDESRPQPALVALVIRKQLHIYSAHTNFDAAPGGVSRRLAEKLSLPVEKAEILEKTGSIDYLKLVVFVPVGHEDKVRDTIAEAGAGRIGNYSHCTFQVPGIGTFRPGKGSRPFIGRENNLEKVQELRLETILPLDRKKAVIEALLSVHPYEEPAYDLYPSALEGKPVGFGLIIDLAEGLAAGELVERCRRFLKPRCLRCYFAGKDRIRRIALCGGSGGSMVESAAQKRADLLISGDFRYHDLKLAQTCGLALIDAGHDATEWPGVFYLKQYLEERLAADRFAAEVLMPISAATTWDLVDG